MIPFLICCYLLPNIKPQYRHDLELRQDTIGHGTAVASILAARGDNGRGITGTMWYADLRLYDVRPLGSTPDLGSTAGQIAYGVMRAAQAGASVINVSIGFNWQRMMGRAPLSVSDSVSEDSARVRRFADQLRLRLAPLNPSPLVVLAAGNDGLDAYWAGFPQLRQDFTNVVVVAEAWAGPTLGANSNRGALVDIAAPGLGVGALDSLGNRRTFSGTSAAAPFASGAAGLLKAFDPSLAASQLRDLLIEGAEQGGRTAGDIPLLNAYESLKAAARRVGAPLCGNHVWSIGSILRTLRGSPAIIDTLGSPLGFLEVLHGGKFIRHVADVSGVPSIRYVAWSPETRQWATSPGPDSTVVRGGTLRSMIGRSHYRDSVLVVNDSSVNVDTHTLPGNRWYDTGTSQELRILTGDTLSAPQEIDTIVVNNFPEPLHVVCVERLATQPAFCTLTVWEVRQWRVRTAYPQYSEGLLATQTALITVSPEHLVPIDSTSWHTCLWDPTRECREFQSSQVSRAAMVYRVDLTGTLGQAVIDSVANESIFWIAQGESGRDVVFGHGRHTITHWFSPDTFRLSPVGIGGYNWVDTVDTCTIEYRERASFPIRIGDPQSAPEACRRGEMNYPTNTIHPYSGAGTIAPKMRTALETRSLANRRDLRDVPLPFRVR